MNKKRIIIIIVFVLVIGLSALLGWYLASNAGSEKIEGIVVDIKDLNYDSQFIKTYDEYIALMKENEIPEDSWDELSEKDFKKNDFIVDYIPYEKDLKVTDINIEIGDGITLNYTLSFEPTKNQQLLLYFIPVEKDLIQNFYIANRHFDYQK